MENKSSIATMFDNIVVFDTETTGLEFASDEIIELAAVKAKPQDGKLVIEAETDMLIKLSDGKTIPELITNLTHITQDMLDTDGIQKEAAARTFADMLKGGNTLLAAYNAQFDLVFSYYFLKQFGLEDALKGVKMLDLLTVYKDRRSYPHKLCNAIEEYRLEGENSHRAIDDVKATVELMMAMEAEQSDLVEYINLFGYNPKYGVSGARISSIRYVAQPYNATDKLYRL